MIELRPLAPEDALGITAAVRESAEELRPWMEWAHADYGMDEARAFIERTTAERERGLAYEYIFSGPSGRLLGLCGLNQIDPQNGRANLGYWIRSSAAGRGLTPLAVRRLAAWAFENTGLHRLEIVIAVENERSQRVAEKAGAQREGVLASRLWLYEVPHDAVVYSLAR